MTRLYFVDAGSYSIISFEIRDESRNGYILEPASKRVEYGHSFYRALWVKADSQEFDTTLFGARKKMIQELKTWVDRANKDIERYNSHIKVLQSEQSHAVDAIDPEQMTEELFG